MVHKFLTRLKFHTELQTNRITEVPNARQEKNPMCLPISDLGGRKIVLKGIKRAKFMFNY